MSNTQQPRFFIDHDCIHDRLNGTHVHGDRSVEPGIADEAVAMLNTLNRLASFAQKQPGIVQERDALKARVAELQVELSRLRSILYDQNSRLESQLASLREWRRVASQKIDQSDPSAVACFINEVVSASLMYNGGTGPSVDALIDKEAP